MDLTASASNTLLSNNRRLLKHEHNDSMHRSGILSEKVTRKSIRDKNIYEDLHTSLLTKVEEDDKQQLLFNSVYIQSDNVGKNNDIFQTPATKIKFNNLLTTKKNIMKKGVSEPNLAKTSENKSPFSPRSLINRLKRILPLSLSKQSLNEKISTQNDPTVTNDSDDSASTSSDNNDRLLTSRLDHVSRVKNAYDSLNTSNHRPSLLTDPNLCISTNELNNLYDYVVHILPEQEFGYFTNGNGCLLTSNFNQQQHQLSPSTSIRFKYPFDANDEVTLKYFCFPDRYDSNNNPLLLTKRTAQEYFRFTLTNMYGIRQYGYCSRFFYKGILNALCIVSPCDMIEIYEKILSTATELFISYKDQEARKFLEEIYAHRLPSSGETIYIPTTAVGLYTLKCEYDRRQVSIDSITLLSLSTGTKRNLFLFIS